MAAATRAVARCARSTRTTPAGIETKNATRWIQPRRRGLTVAVASGIGEMVPPHPWAPPAGDGEGGRAAGSGAVADPVADTSDRLDEPWRLGIVSELAPQAGDVHVDHAVVAEPVRTPDQLEELRAREHHPRPRGQRLEEIELQPRQLDLHAVHVDLARVRVDDDTAELPSRCAGRHRPGPHDVGYLGAVEPCGLRDGTVLPRQRPNHVEGKVAAALRGPPEGVEDLLAARPLHHVAGGAGANHVDDRGPVVAQRERDHIRPGGSRPDPQRGPGST